MIRKKSRNTHSPIHFPLKQKAFIWHELTDIFGLSKQPEYNIYFEQFCAIEIHKGKKTIPTYFKNIFVSIHVP